jgi:hypothetical protein
VENELIRASMQKKRAIITAATAITQDDDECHDVFAALGGQDV